jgi:hypothetical protein
MMAGTALVFAGYVVLVLLAVLLVGARFLPRRAFLTLVVGSLAWLTYVGVMSYFGVVRNPALKPPGAAYLLLPAAAMIAYLARSGVGLRIALRVPATWLIGIQVFRIGVELLLHRLYVDGLVPRLMTYEGGNVDIAIGLSAPLIAWLASRGSAARRWALVWNLAGLAALANVAIRAIGTAPGALNFIHSEVPNLAVGMFPFTYVAGFFAPLAVVLHVLAIRALRAGARTAHAGGGATGSRQGTSRSAETSGAVS